MFRNLCAIFCLYFTGCIWYVAEPDNTSSDTSYGADIWIEKAYVSCSPVGSRSEWYMEATVGAWDANDESQIDVTVYIDGWDWYWTNSVGGYVWARSFMSSYYQCNEMLDFYFVVQDIYGNENSTTVHWW